MYAAVQNTTEIINCNLKIFQHYNIKKLVLYTWKDTSIQGRSMDSNFVENHSLFLERMVVWRYSYGILPYLNIKIFL